VSPLAADPRYRPATRAMAAILPFLDAIADGSGLAALERLPKLLSAVENAARGQALRRGQFTFFGQREPPMQGAVRPKGSKLSPAATPEPRS
jgi:hypothetical protein